MSPPLHRHEISEPLIVMKAECCHHVSDLVCDHKRHSYLVGKRGCLLIDQQIHLTERHAAPVLHGSRSKVRNRKQVELLEGIWNVEEILVMSRERYNDSIELDRMQTHLQGEFSPAALSQRSITTL